MIKFFFKLILITILLGVASPTHAFKFGMYEVAHIGEEVKGEEFNVCIQEGGNWYVIRDGKGWVGKWVKSKSKEMATFQAINVEKKRMKSFSMKTDYSDRGSVYGHYLDTFKGGMEITVTYKGARCTSREMASIPATPQREVLSPPKEEFHELPSVGNWLMGVQYTNNKFDSCVIALAGDYNFLAVSTRDNKVFELRLPPVDGLIPKTTVRMQDQIGNLQSRTHNMSIMQDGSASMTVSDLWIGEFFQMVEGHPEGTVFDTYYARLGNMDMNWKTGDSMEAFDALTGCIGKYKGTSL